MYSRCTPCHAFLGRNEVLEPFPIGRRLAFDPANGRLWVLCRSCRQWNLVPMEERWEAVEEAERLFERSAVGASTENVGLGRLAEGTELIRIGRVHRHEMAAWRYGDRLVGRWRRHRRTFQASIGAGLILGAIPIVAELAVAGAAAWAGALLLRDQQPVMRTAGGRPVRRGDAAYALLLPDNSPRSWKLVLPRLRGDDISLTGHEGLLALRKLLPRANFRGGSHDVICHSGRWLEHQSC